MPHAPATQILSLDLPCAPGAPGTTRAALRSTDATRGARDDVLVASELVTNAVVISEGEPEHLLDVSVSDERRHVLISVHGAGVSRRRAGIRPAGNSGVGASGLRLVAQLAERWDADRRDGFRVWARVAVPADAGGAEPGASAR